MAKSSFVDTLTGGLDASVRRALRAVSDYYFNNLRLGVPEDATRAENFQMYCFSATTPATAGTEFSISHGCQTPPVSLIPVLNLAHVGEQIVPLTVTRAADTSRVYLSSTSTNAPIRVWVEV
jgi:hypothetical protein